MNTILIFLLFATTTLFASSDSCSNAIKLDINSTTHQSLSNHYRRYYYTYYKFTPTTDGTLTITTTGMNSDSDGWLYDNLSDCQKGSNYVAYDNEYTNNITVIYKVQQDTTYYLPIRNYTNHSDDFNITLSLSDASLAKKRPFVIRNPPKTRNIQGNVKIIGNTVLCYKKDGKCVENTSPNNDTSLSYIKEIDGFTDSSKAKISGVPDNAEVVWAGFYAQGYTNESLGKVRQDLTSQPMHLIAPDNSSYPIYPAVIDSLKWNGYTYSTFSPVNILIGKKGSEINGWWSGANIKAREGKDSNLGYFGAWTLVIIYKDNSENYRNISVFDGYRNISKNNPDETIQLKGFYTPKSGDIHSTFSFFSGEGDIAYDGDKLYFNGTQIGNSNNVMYSNTSGFKKEPSLTNNFGIDIQNIDIGTSGKNLLGHQDSSATVRFTSTGDSYYPSMFVFTTDIYAPNICYDYTYGQNNSYLTAPNKINASIDGTFTKSTPIDVKLYFQNQENSDIVINNLKLHIDPIDTQKAKYRPNSVFVTPPGGTKTHLDDSTFTAVSPTGSYVQGIPIGNGNFESLNYFYTYYSLDPEISDIHDMLINATLDYSLSVEIDGTKIDLGSQTSSIQKMQICYSNLPYEPVPGRFNVVQAGEIKNDDPYYYFNIPTQVVNRVGNFLLESMDPDTDFNTTKAVDKATDVNITMVNMAGFHYTDATCTDPDNSIVIGTPVSVHFNVNDNNVSVAKNSMRSASMFSRASQNAAFRLMYKDENNSIQTTCSRDNFAIRPEAYSFQFTDYNHSNPTQLQFIKDNNGSSIKTLNLAAGYNYLFKAYATDHLNHVPVSGYNTSNSDANMTWQGASTLTCNNENNITLAPTFMNGATDLNKTWSDIGKYKLHMQDTSWTQVDSDISYMQHHQTPYFKMGRDCLFNNDSVQPENSSSYNGCYISSFHTNTEYSQSFQDMLVIYHPYKFDLSNIIPSIGTNHDANIGANSFIYMSDLNNSNDENMSFHLNGTIDAVGADNVLTSNFVSGCYAEPLIVNVNKKHINLPVAYQYKLHILDENGTQLREKFGDLNNTPNTIGIPATDFIKSAHGNVNTILNLNYSRVVNAATNPQEITFDTYNAECVTATNCTFAADLNLTNETTGKKDLNTTIKHYYGRTHAPRQRYVGSDGNASIYYEVFCDVANDGNKSLLQNGLSSRYTDDPRWFVNTAHQTARDGQVNAINQRGFTVGSGSVRPVTIDGATPTKSTLHYYDASTKGYPYKATMEINSSNWLIYNKYNANATKNEFEVEFINPAGNWAGQTQTDSTTKTNAAKVTNRRLMW